MIYEGDKPYIFISYSHDTDDKGVVIPLINELFKNRYRVWYDDGVHLSNDWPDVIADHLANARLVIFMVSNNFIASINCKREVFFSADEGKDMFLVYLEQVNLPNGIKMQTAGVNNMFFYKESLDTFVNKMFEKNFIDEDELKMSEEEYLDVASKDYNNKQQSFIPSMSIAIGIIKHHNSVVMLKRRKDEDGLSWGFPATMIKPSDQIENRLVREVKNETNLNTRFVRFLGNRVHPNTHTIAYYCQLEYIDGELQNMEEDENAEARWVPLDTYKSFITSDLYIKVSEFLEEPDPDVAMCIVMKEGKVLIVHRNPKVDDLGWVFPGGTIENGEDALTAAKRELKEETNVTAIPMDIIAKRIHPKSKKHIVYVSLNVTNDNTIVLGDDDLDDVKWVNYNEIDDYFTYPAFAPVKEYLLSEFGYKNKK